MLRQSRKESPGLRVVATIRSTRYAAFLGEEPELAEALGDPVRLSRLLSPAERARAEESYPDVDFGQGIAAAFTATGSLLTRMHAGDIQCPFEPVGGDCTLARV